MSNNLQEAFNKYLEELYNAVADEKADLKDYFKQRDSAEQVVRNAYTGRSDYKQKDFADINFAKDCYKDVLEGDESYRDILHNHARIREKDEEWVSEVRENKFYKGKELVDSFKEHPVQEAMTSAKNFIPSHAKYKESLGGILKYTQESVNKHRQFEGLLRKTEVVQELQTQLDSQSFDIDEIKHHLNLIPSDRGKKARYLRDKGYKIKKIAGLLEVSESTVKRLLR